MTPSAIYSKSGKGVQEASGKTSLLSRADRSVLSAFDGKLTVSEVAERVGKPFDAKFQQLILQLDKDGYVREVSAGTAKPAAAPARPAAPAAKPAAAGGGAPASDLDFTIAIPASPPPKPKAPAAPPPVDPATKARAETERKGQEDNMARARREAEEKAQKERDRVKAEVEAKVRAETEAKLRSEAEEKAKTEAGNKIKAEAEAKVKAARDAAARVAAEAKAKAEAEANAKLEVERAKIREEAEKAKREAEELRQRLEEERKAREAEERKRKEEEDRRRKEEEARRAREEAERKAREAEEHKRKEEEERRRKEEEERRAREEAERKAREAEERERQAREEAERKEREAQAARERSEGEARMRQAREDKERRDREKEERAAGGAPAQAQEKPKAKEKAAASGGSFDSLMADLDSFSDRDDADKKAKEDVERKEKDEKKARKEREESERKAKEQAEEARKEAEEKARKEEKKRKEEEERRAREEEEENAKREAEERKRKKREAAAAKEEAAPKSDDIGVSDDDLDMDDVKADQQAVSKESRKEAREREREAKEREREARERAREREREAKRAASGAPAPAAGAAAYKPFRRKKSWGKPIAVTLFLLLIAAVGAVHVMPLSTADYEKAASEAIGQPVKMGAAHLSLYSGVQLNIEGVSVGNVRIAVVRAFPEIGSLFDDKKAFSRIELDGISLPQQTLGAVLAAHLRGPNFSVGRLNIRQLKLPGPLAIPVLDADVAVTTDGSVGVIQVRGPDNLVAKLTPNGSAFDFDVTASGFTLPFVPDVTLSTFAMKGRATGEGARIESWGGAQLDGAINGTANVRWGNNWSIDGSMEVRGINAAVFAPALLSEGKAEGTGRFSMSDPDPANFRSRGRVEGTFSLNKGVLGSFDLSRAIQTGGRQATGRTPFTEMNGQGVFDKGNVALRGVTFGAGAMHASASADITPDGALSGRIIADIRTSAQNLRATVNIGGTVKEPQVK